MTWKALTKIENLEMSQARTQYEYKTSLEKALKTRLPLKQWTMMKAASDVAWSDAWNKKFPEIQSRFHSYTAGPFNKERVEELVADVNSLAKEILQQPIPSNLNNVEDVASQLVFPFLKQSPKFRAVKGPTDDDECVVCKSNSSDLDEGISLIPLHPNASGICTHESSCYICQECHQKIVESDNPICPICREPLIEIIPEQITRRPRGGGGSLVAGSVMEIIIMCICAFFAATVGYSGLMFVLCGVCILMSTVFSTPMNNCALFCETLSSGN